MAGSMWRKLLRAIASVVAVSLIGIGHARAGSYYRIIFDCQPVDGLIDASNGVNFNASTPLTGSKSVYGQSVTFGGGLVFRDGTLPAGSPYATAYATSNINTTIPSVGQNAVLSNYLYLNFAQSAQSVSATVKNYSSAAATFLLSSAGGTSDPGASKLSIAAGATGVLIYKGGYGAGNYLTLAPIAPASAVTNYAFGIYQQARCVRQCDPAAGRCSSRRDLGRPGTG